MSERSTISAEQALAVLEPKGGEEIVPGTPWTRTQAITLARTIAPGLSPDEFRLFGARCHFTGLDPFQGQIHAIIRGTGQDRKLCIQTGIDGLRLIAARTGEYVGQDEPQFEYAEGGDRKRPSLARVVVYRLQGGQRIAYPGVARWDEFCPGGGKDFMWRDKPHHMLAKVAEAQAFRRAFPNETSQLFVEEELARPVDPPKAGSVLMQRLAGRHAKPAALEAEHGPQDEQHEPAQEEATIDLRAACEAMIARLPENMREGALDTLATLGDDEIAAYSEMLEREVQAPKE